VPLLNKLPNDQGNNGDVLTTDGAGTLSWAAPAGGSSASVELRASVTSTQTLTANANTDVVFGTVTTSPSASGASYNNATGVYTAGTGGGIFMVTAQVVPNAQNNVGIMVVAGGTTYYGTLVSNNQFPTPFARASITTVVALTAGQTIKVAVSGNNTAATITNESLITIVKL
jgi:hypothetical protein